MSKIRDDQKLGFGNYAGKNETFYSHLVKALSHGDTETQPRFLAREQSFGEGGLEDIHVSFLTMLFPRKQEPGPIYSPELTLTP